MPIRMRMPNGDIITVRDGTSPEQAVEAWKLRIEQEFGYDRNFKMKSGDEAAREASEQWVKDNPVAARVASFQAGVHNLGRNVANMLGLQDDEEVLQSQAQDAPLREAYGGMYTAGEVVPTFALGAAGRVPVLARTMAAHPIAAGAVEGGAVGAALAGPGERVRGATVGAATGGAGGALVRSIERLGRGVAPPTAEARRAMADTGTPIGAPRGERPFIPLSKAGQTTGEGGAVTYLYDKILPHFGAASRRLAAQTQEAADATRRNLLRRAYRGASDDVIDTWQRTGRMDRGLDVGEQILGDTEKSLGPLRRTLGEAARRTRHAGTPTLEEIAKVARTSKEANKASVRAMRETAETMDQILKRKVPEEGFVQARHAMYEGLRMVGSLLIIPSLIARGMSSKGFQKFLMGTTELQEAFARAAATGQGQAVAQTIERALRGYLISSGMSEIQVEELLQRVKNVQG